MADDYGMDVFLGIIMGMLILTTIIIVVPVVMEDKHNDVKVANTFDNNNHCNGNDVIAYYDQGELVGYTECRVGYENPNGEISVLKMR